MARVKVTKTVTKKRVKKSDSGKEKCRICNGTGFQTTPKKGKKK